MARHALFAALKFMVSHVPERSEWYMAEARGTDYVKTSSVKILFFNTALPEPVFKYFSNFLAVASVLTAIKAFNSTSLRRLVE